MQKTTGIFFALFTALTASCIESGTIADADNDVIAEADVALTPDSESPPDASQADAGPTDFADVTPQADAQGQDAVPQSCSRVYKLHTQNATRVEVWFYDAAMDQAPRATYEMQRGDDLFEINLSCEDTGLDDGVTYYGFRAFGPNWPHVDGFTPGSDLGFITDVDAEGHRFNPNKLLIDPEALELSHDFINANFQDATLYASGEHRNRDSGPFAPKAVQSLDEGRLELPRVDRPLKDDVIYEVHVRGLTMLDESIPQNERGTYKGAASKAAELKALGITAIEFLPVNETQNEQNDLDPNSPEGDNYWGYASTSFFALERRFSSDQSPGGVIREFKAMVDAFHAEGIKVYVDAVFNHAGEGGLWGPSPELASVQSFRGIDNAAYYELSDDAGYYYNNNGVGPNINVANAMTRDHLIRSLQVYKNELGVDGFRFDLASVLGNACERGCFRFDKFDEQNFLNRAAREVPERTFADDGDIGVDLIAEPWAIGGGTYQVGEFPHGWAEWNGEYRDLIRKDQNELGVTAVTLAQVTDAVAGSAAMYEDDGRSTWHSVNFVTAHDGLTMNDVFSCNDRDNDQPWPYGPSDGGHDTNHAWDQGGDRAAQLQAMRTSMALMLVSRGTPMLLGGDEVLRTRRCNNNGYNLDSVANYLPGELSTEQSDFRARVSEMIRIRMEEPVFRGDFGFDGQDHDDDGLADVTWLGTDGQPIPGDDYARDDLHFLAWHMDGNESGSGSSEVLVAYNGWSSGLEFQLPPGTWQRVYDTSATTSVADESSGSFIVSGRSVVVWRR